MPGSSMSGGSLYRRKGEGSRYIYGNSLHRLILYGEDNCLAFFRTEALVIYTKVHYAGTFVFHARGLSVLREVSCISKSS